MDLGVEWFMKGIQMDPTRYILEKNVAGERLDMIIYFSSM